MNGLERGKRALHGSGRRLLREHRLPRRIPDSIDFTRNPNQSLNAKQTSNEYYTKRGQGNEGKGGGSEGENSQERRGPRRTSARAGVLLRALALGQVDAASGGRRSSSAAGTPSSGTSRPARRGEDVVDRDLLGCPRRRQWAASH